MSLQLILAIIFGSIVYWVVVSATQRRNVLLVASLLLLYALQPHSDIGPLNILFPTVSIIMVVGVWLIISTPGSDQTAGLRQVVLNGGLALLVIAALILLSPQRNTLLTTARDMLARGQQNQIGLLASLLILVGVVVLALPKGRSFLLLAACLLILLLWMGQAPQGLPSLDLPAMFQGSLPGKTPVMLLVAVSALSVGPVFIPSTATRKKMALIWLGLMVAALAIIKVESLNLSVSAQIRGESSLPGTSPFDLRWIGISYVIFRLAHVLIDFRDDGLEVTANLPDFATYVLFFPSLVAGPITRLEEVVPQLRENLQAFRLDFAVDGLFRVLLGVFKKFVIADQLLIIAAKPALFSGSNHPAVLWIMLYAALFQLYFDFSGYSDIAIGLARLFGVGLPENFDRPLLQPNLQLFWQSWHMTLARWFRQYWFNPLTRRLIQTPLRRRQNAVVLISQVSTMSLIGLWHGVSLNWVLWGAWHGFGLYFYKVLGDANRKRFRQWIQNPLRAQAIRAVNVVLTFHFVLLSMVFVVFPTIGQAVRYLLALFGAGQ
jgi:alginate O-acetyltransferase complex protein AlgI